MPTEYGFGIYFKKPQNGTSTIRIHCIREGPAGERSLQKRIRMPPGGLIRYVGQTHRARYAEEKQEKWNHAQASFWEDVFYWREI